MVWFFLCQKCGWKVWTKKFWKCINPFTNCCFLRWMILGHELAAFVLGWAQWFGLYTPPGWIWIALGFGFTGWSALWSIAKCKSFPILLNPSTWPPANVRNKNRNIFETVLKSHQYTHNHRIIFVFGGIFIYSS
ncbi:hypothetical protein LCGC14_0685410 [marine sediment metagenome]|uniref:Uncharacterized protein n=1 Tax=marine sediment metagenome TaxID=412755 RepID=A0A0F9QRW8_9ZZZZ